ncbi:MAG: calcium/sodium antiporter, partial [Proteobacteria bacterium]|nr:calcium/sodium antiporter [Pseudomonadota bacterium]
MIGLVALTLGAEGLVRGSASLAIRLGLTPLIIGLTIVSFGTSMPEMVVSVGASLNNQSDIAIGNVVGSNIFNIGVILGITALICPIHVNLKLVKIDIPIMIVAALVSLILVSTGTVSRLTGVLLFSGLIAYTVFTVFMAEKENRPDIKLEFQEGIPGLSKSLSLDFLFIGGGLLLLILGSRLLVLSATDFARILGISEAVIALTIIAAGTSLPELATSFVAALRRQPDIAVGNVVGS